ncbi:MAG TPA: MFS transporter, partial [Aggregatilineaceae bacterium]|nr:MFS transporter [Aggregatilineaceae bacterium]
RSSTFASKRLSEKIVSEEIAMVMPTKRKTRINADFFVDTASKLGLSIAPPSWETLFILNIPISILAMIGAWWALRGVEQLRKQRVVPQVEPKQGFLSGLRNLRFDFLGALLIAVALLGLNLGLGTSSPETAATVSSFQDRPNDYRGAYLVVGAIALGLFLLVELWVRHPLIPLKHFRSRNFTSAALTNLLVGFCLAIGLVSGPLLVNFRADTPSNEDIQEAAYIAGWILSGLTVPMMLAAVPGGWLTNRRGYRFPTMIGLALAAVGFVLAGISWTEDTSYITMAVQMAVIGVGLGLTISPIGTAALNEAAEDERGTVSALILVLRLVGMTIAISSLTIFSLSRFDAKVDDRIADLRDTRLEQALQQAEADYQASLPFSPWALLIRNFQIHQAQIQADSLSFTSDEISDVNFGAAVEAINEMLFIGAGVSVLALLIALALRAGRGPVVARSTAPPEGETPYRDRPASSL